jgi:hypothetical protein
MSMSVERYPSEIVAVFESLPSTITWSCAFPPEAIVLAKSTGIETATRALPESR